MEIEALVKSITEEVMKQLQERETSEKLQSSKKALVLSYREQVNRQDIKQLETMGVECVFLEECIEEEIKNVDCIVLLALSLSSLAYIAMGIEGDEVSKRTIRGLLYGKEIFVLSKGLEHRNFEKTSHPHFYQTYMNYEKKLQSFGMKIGDLKEIFSQSNQQIKLPQVSIEEKNQIEETFISNKVITEKGLREMGCGENSRICIGAKAIITPMATDYIRTKKIQAVRI
ncbi:ethanolamine utilization protein [Anaerovirgula multivorans]|uniref:Ethanolamine utilization protein n=1 Tax=Anaerovirgula multivorans TaxID=312168 RepID=A0A239BWJ0_9FIRM|nr:hypothetical protein [Anaerovirgula multivorans]SNS12415.1 ethanolamine utilization protein [Anaerovirgula multivorans]